MNHDVAIIGAGPGGIAAAVQSKRLGLFPVLIDKTGRAGGLIRHAFSIENYPGIPPTTGLEFTRLLKTHLHRFDIGIHKNSVTWIEKHGLGYRIHMGDESKTAHAVIVATGTSPKKLGFPGAKWVEYNPQKTLEQKPRRTIIIGGGEAALDFALSLQNAGIRVTVCVRGNHLKAVGRLADTTRSLSGIDFLFQALPLRLEKNSNAYTLIVETCNQSKSLNANAIISAIGRVPCLPRFSKGLDEGTCKTVSTPHPGLFIIGDARRGTLGQAGMAVGDGLNAAALAAEHLGRIKRG